MESLTAFVLANLVPLLIGAAVPVTGKLLHALAKWLRAAAKRTPSPDDDKIANALADVADDVGDALTKDKQ